MNPKQKSDSSVAVNRKAWHEYTIEEHFEAGIALQGWEVKSLRAGRVQLDQSYILLKNNEVWVIGLQISPLPTTSTHILADPQRTRKLLLNRKEINKLIGSVERKGYTLLPLKLYWKNNRIKLDIALAKGKKQHDKRAAEKTRDWSRDKQRLLKNFNTR